MGKADIYIFLFFVQPEDVLNLRINFNEFQSIYAYKKVFTCLSLKKKDIFWKKVQPTMFFRNCTLKC